MTLTSQQRTDLIDKLGSTLLDSMGIGELVDLAACAMVRQLEELSDTDLVIEAEMMEIKIVEGA